MTTKKVGRCIAPVQASRAIPLLDLSHAYNPPELIDIAEDASPAGRIAWAAAKVSLEQEGIDRALYLPILTFAAQGSDVRAIVPLPKPLAPRGYVTVEQPLAYAQLELEYSLLAFGRGPRLDGSRALELASTEEQALPWWSFRTRLRPFHLPSRPSVIPMKARMRLR